MKYHINSGVETEKSKTKIVFVAAIASVLLVAGIAMPTLAAPGDNGSGYGGCVDNFYGNATNERPSGNGVLPSQSPGPFVNTGFNEPPRDDRTRGLSMGEVQQLGRDAGLNGKETMEVVCLFP